MTQIAISATQMPFIFCERNGTVTTSANGSLNCSFPFGGNRSVPTSHPDFCSVGMDTYSQLYQLFLIAVLIVSLAGNFIVVVGILTSRVLRSSVTNIFIVSLAVSDIGVTLFLVPIKIDAASHNQLFCRGLGLCIFWHLTDIFFNVASVTNLLVITIDRFLAVTSPFSYPSLVTRGRGFLMVSCLWIYAACWTASAVIKWDDTLEFNIKILHTPSPVCVNQNPVYFTTVYTAVFIVPLIVMGVLYFIILRAAIRQARAITSLEVGNESQKNKRLTKYRREIKATKTISIVYGAFLVCWMPVCIISIHGNWCLDCYLRLRDAHPILHKFIYITFVEVLPPLNSTLNPFIYVIFGKQFRAGFSLLLYKLLGKVRGEGRFFEGTMIFSRDRSETQQGLKRTKPSSMSDASQC